MARIHGKNGAVYLGIPSGGTAKSVPGMSEWTLDQTTDKVDVTGFNDSNKRYVPGLKDIKGTVSAWFESDDDTLFDAADAPNGVDLALYPSTALPAIFHAGPAWVDASITVSVSGAVSLKGSFAANGAWTRGSSAALAAKKAAA